LCEKNENWGRPEYTLQVVYT